MNRTAWIVLLSALSPLAASADIDLPPDPAFPIRAGAARPPALPAADPADALENLRRKAIDEYNGGFLERAERSFFDLLAANVVAKTAPYALDYLKRIQKATGRFEEARRQYEELRDARKIDEKRFAFGDRIPFLAELARPGKTEAFIADVFKVGGLIAARSSLVGVIFSEMGMQAQATYFLERGAELTGQHQERERRTSAELASTRIRPLRFVYPEYRRDRLEVPYLQAFEPMVVPFMTPAEESAWEAEAPRPRRSYFQFAYLYRYESNPRLLPADDPGARGSVVHEGIFSFGTLWNPIKPRSYGFDYSLVSRSHVRDDLVEYDRVSHLPSLWWSIWNRSDTEARLRYDAAITHHRAGNTRDLSLMHGPQAGVARRFRNGTRLDLIYGFRVDRDEYDPDDGPTRRAANSHELGATLSRPKRENKSTPFLAYRLGRHDSDGSLYNSIRHRLTTGSTFRVGERGSLSLSLSYLYEIYPGAGRTDREERLDVGMLLPAGRVVGVTVDGNYRRRSSPLAAFEANEYSLGAGLTVTLDF